jgi:hypothetical protein
MVVTCEGMSCLNHRKTRICVSVAVISPFHPIRIWGNDALGVDSRMQIIANSQVNLGRSSSKCNLSDMAIWARLDKSQQTNHTKLNNRKIHTHYCLQRREPDG